MTCAYSPPIGPKRYLASLTTAGRGGCEEVRRWPGSQAPSADRARRAQQGRPVPRVPPDHQDPPAPQVRLRQEARTRIDSSRDSRPNRGRTYRRPGSPPARRVRAPAIPPIQRRTRRLRNAAENGSFRHFARVDPLAFRIGHLAAWRDIKGEFVAADANAVAIGQRRAGANPPARDVYSVG